MSFFRHPLVATLSAAMLAARLLAPDVWHSCPEMASVVESAHATGAEAGAAHAHAHDTMAHAAGATDEDASSPAPHECDCDTSCCCLATAATRPTVDHFTVAAAEIDRTVPASWLKRYAPARVDLQLPFNTPPPHVA